MLAQPSDRLGEAIDSLHGFVLANATSDAAPREAILAAAGREPQDEKPLDRMVRHVLLAMLEERQTRRPEQPGSFSSSGA